MCADLLSVLLSALEAKAIRFSTPVGIWEMAAPTPYGHVMHAGRMGKSH